MKAIIRLVAIALGALLGWSVTAAEAGTADPAFQIILPASSQVQFMISTADGLICAFLGDDSIAKYNWEPKPDPNFHFEASSGTFLVYLHAIDSQGRIFVSATLTNREAILYRLLADGSLDASFSPARANTTYYGVLPLPDSRILAAGLFTNLNGAFRPGLVRLTANGEVDPTFAPSEGGPFKSIALAPDGDYFFSGSLHRYSADGTYKASFQYGKNISYFAKTIVPPPDGGLLISEAFASARLLADGAVDLSFTNNLWPRLSLILPDGRILLSALDPANGQFKDRFVRLFADGQEDSSFSFTLPLKVTAMTLGPDGSPYIAGSITTNFQNLITRVSLQNDAAPAAVQFNRALASVGEGNTILLTLLRDGDASNPATVDYATRADSALGSRDFVQSNGIVTFEPGQRIASIEIQTLASAVSEPDRAFHIDLSNAKNAVLATNKSVQVTILDRQSIAQVALTSRTFSETDGPVQLKLTRSGALAYPRPIRWSIEPLNPSDSNKFAALQGETLFAALDSETSVDLHVSDDALPESDKSFRLTLSSSDPNLFPVTPAETLISVMENDWPNDPGRGVDDTIEQAVFAASGAVVIAGKFRTVNGSFRPQLARLLSTGQLDPTFNPPILDGPSPIVSKLLPLPDGKLIVMGSFTNVGTISRKYLLRLNSDGTLDESFDASNALPSQPAAVAALPDGRLLVLGPGTDYNGVLLETNLFVIRKSLGALVRLEPDGTKDTNFTTGVRLDSPYSPFICVLPDGRFLLAGNLAVYSSFPPPLQVLNIPPARRYLARFFNDGTLDTNLNVVLTVPASGAGNLFSSVSVNSKGEMLLAGSMQKINNISVGTVAKLTADGSLDLPFTTNVPKNFPSAGFSGVITLDGGAFLLVGSGIYPALIDTFAKVNSEGNPDPSFQPLSEIEDPQHATPFWLTSTNGTALLLNTQFGSRVAWFYPNGSRAADVSLLLETVSQDPTGTRLSLDVRTGGTLVIQRSFDLSVWEDVFTEPAVPGPRIATLPSSETAAIFFRAKAF
jgi:uncharacterized delta-60 repeat protein